MKFNLKESLSRMGLLSEGWMQDLSSEHDEHTLHFVQQILSDSYPGQDISNNLLAPWIAKISKERGAPLNIDAKGLKSIKFAFKVILEYFKATGESPDIARQLSGKKDKDAFKQAKEGLEELKTLEARAEEGLNPEEELREWIDSGEIRVIGTGSKGSIWVEVLKKSWLSKSACGLESVRNPGREGRGKLFGIACQVTGGGDRGPWTGEGDTSFTLLGKDSDGYYRALLSATANKERGNFYEIKQRANKHLGAESALGWLNLDADFADFIINNPEGKKIYKFDTNSTEDEFGNEISGNRRAQGNTYGAFGEFSYLLNNKRDTVFRILQGKPKTLLYYKELLENTLTPEELLSLTQKVEDVYIENQEKFIKELGSFLKSQKEETLRILENFDFPSFIREFGEESLLQSINEILLNMNFDKFMEVIYPFINFENFIRRNDKKELKEFFRRISERENSPKKFLKILNELTQKHGDAIFDVLGNGIKSKGIGSLIGILATPRLEKHQDYERVSSNKFIAQVEEIQRNADGTPIIDSRTGQPAFKKTPREIKPTHFILDLKGIRRFLNNNKNEFEKSFGEGDEGKIKFLKYILTNSSEQAREKELKQEKDNYINYYDEQYAKGENDIPGVMQYAKDLSSEIHSTGLKKHFENPNIKILSFDSGDFKTSRFINNILKYYIKNSKRKGIESIASSIGALLETAKVSGFSDEQINSFAFNAFSPEKILKKELPYSVYNSYLLILIELVEYGILKKEGVLEYAKSAPIVDSVRKSKRVTDEHSYRALIERIGNMNLEEQNTRKYVANLLESSYRKYLKQLKKKEQEQENLSKKKRPHTPQ